MGTVPFTSRFRTMLAKTACKGDSPLYKARTAIARDRPLGGSLRAMQTNRREFFEFLAASTVLTPSGRAWAQQLAASHDPSVITSAADALQVADFEEAAHRALPPAHGGYRASGSDDDLTLKANVEAFKHVGLKPRRLVDVSK